MGPMKNSRISGVFFFSEQQGRETSAALTRTYLVQPPGLLRSDAAPRSRFACDRQDTKCKELAELVALLEIRVEAGLAPSPEKSLGRQVPGLHCGPNRRPECFIALLAKLLYLLAIAVVLPYTIQFTSLMRLGFWHARRRAPSTSWTS